MQKHEERPVCFLNAGRISYLNGLTLQDYFHKKIAQDGHAPVVLFMEHYPVYTLGKHATRSNILGSPQWLSERNIDVIQTERGGQVTAHMPGQLVIYPILNLPDHGFSVKSWVCLLEESTIRVLKRYDVHAHRDSDHPGVWIGQEKIAAIGIRIKKRTSCHGIAINIDTDPDLFDGLIPCGIKDRGVVNLSNFVQSGVSLNKVAKEWLEEFSLMMQKTGRPVGLKECVRPDPSDMPKLEN